MTVWLSKYDILYFCKIGAQKKGSQICITQFSWSHMVEQNGSKVIFVGKRCQRACPKESFKKGKGCCLVMARCDVQVCIWSKKFQHEIDQRSLSWGITDDGSMVTALYEFEVVESDSSEKLQLEDTLQITALISLAGQGSKIFQNLIARKSIDGIFTLEKFYARWKKMQVMYFLSFFSMDQGSNVWTKYHCDNHLNRKFQFPKTLCDLARNHLTKKNRWYNRHRIDLMTRCL